MVETEKSKRSVRLTDAFVLVCGTQIGLFIQYRKLEMHIDSFWNDRLLFLCLATALAFFVAARAYAIILAALSEKNFADFYCIDAISYCPLLLFGIYPLLRGFIFIDVNHSFKLLFAVVMLLVLLLKACLMLFVVRPSPKAYFKVSAVILALFVSVLLLWMHYLSWTKDRSGSTAVYRDVAVETGSYKDTCKYRILLENDSMKMTEVIPSEARLVIAFKPVALPDRNTMRDGILQVRLIVRDRRTGETEKYERAVRNVQLGKWMYFKDFVNHGKSSEFDITIEDALIPSDEIWNLFRPWLAPSREETVKVRLPKVEIKRTEDMPNVIYVSIDMLRSDHMSLYGYKRKTTPNIDKLAAESLWFDRCYSAATWTMPSHMTALTSVYTSTHGINDFETSVEKIPFPSVQALLQEKNYNTVAFTDGHSISAKYGFDTGFDDFFEEVGTYENPKKKDMAKKTFGEAMKWIDEHADTPFFMLIHTFEAHHFPFDIDEQRSIYAQKDYNGFFKNKGDGKTTFVDKIHEAAKDDTLVTAEDVQYAIDLYDGGIFIADRELGRLLDFLKQRGLFDNTLIVVSSDHGESFRNYHDNGKVVNWYHSGLPYLEQISIPLVMKLPDRLKLQREITAPVSLLDLAPTILDVLNIPKPKSFSGNSILPLARQETENIGHPIIDERIFRKKKEPCRFSVTVISGMKKYSCGGVEGDPKVYQEEYYDLANDPHEEKNIIQSSEGSKELEMLRQIAKRHIDEKVRPGFLNNQAGKFKIDAEHLKSIRDLGYLN